MVGEGNDEIRMTNDDAAERGMKMGALVSGRMAGILFVIAAIPGLGRGTEGISWSEGTGVISGLTPGKGESCECAPVNAAAFNFRFSRTIRA